MAAFKLGPLLPGGPPAAQSRYPTYIFRKSNSTKRNTECKYLGGTFNYIYFFMIYVTMLSTVQAPQCGIVVNALMSGVLER
jgi:hypothetical protein